MITIADHTLSRLVAQTRPHVGNLIDAEAVQCITFDHDGRHLYAMATNRYTIAVSRTQVIGGDDKPWAAIVHRTQLPELAAAVKLLDADAVELERTDSQLILSGKRGRLARCVTRLAGHSWETFRRGARAPHHQFAFQSQHLLLILSVTDADRRSSLRTDRAQAKRRSNE